MLHLRCACVQLSSLLTLCPYALCVQVLVPGAHMHALNPDVDGPGMTPAELDAKLAELEILKAEAIAADDLEMALHWKRYITVLQTNAGAVAQQGGGGASAAAAAADSTAALLRNRFNGPRL